jgi:excisionase family DNA binding protein
LADEPIVLRVAAARTGLSASHLRTLARTGQIEAYRLGRDWLTTETAVREYLATKRQRARGPYRRKDADT